MSHESDIPRATLMAYADGELNEIEARRVAKALNADPALAAQVDAHRALRRRIAGAYAPAAQAPVPDRLAAMLDRAPLPLPAPRTDRRRHWATGLAAAASLAIGLTIGRILPLPETAEAGPGVGSVAARALDTQLAAAQPADAAVRIGISFRATGGELCRTYAEADATGIACRDGGGWTLRHWAAAPRQDTAYRQAGATAIAGIADTMMAGVPLDAAQEREALVNDWK